MPRLSSTSVMVWTSCKVNDTRRRGEGAVAQTVLSSHGSTIGASGSCGTRFVHPSLRRYAIFSLHD